MRFVTEALVKPAYCQPAVEDRQEGGFGGWEQVPCLDGGQKCWRTAKFFLDLVRLPHPDSEVMYCARGLGHAAGGIDVN